MICISLLSPPPEESRYFLSGAWPSDLCPETRGPGEEISVTGVDIVVSDSMDWDMLLTAAIALFTSAVLVVYYKMWRQMEKDLQVGNYPFLSQYLVYDIYNPEELHYYPAVARSSDMGYRLNIGNFGKGAAVDQKTEAIYLPAEKELQNGKAKWYKDFAIIQAHNKISPEANRPLNLTILSRLEREKEMTPENIFWGSIESLNGRLFIRLRHCDLMGNKYCVCSEYQRIKETNIRGKENRKFPGPLAKLFPESDQCDKCPFEWADQD